MPQVKGTLLLGALKFIKHSQHAAGIPGVLAALPAEAMPAFARPIVAAQWYPYASYTGLLRAIDACLGSGDGAMMPVLGRFAARHDLAGVFKVISALASIPRILQSSSVFWSRYCDAGVFEVTDLHDEQGTGQLREFPQVAPEHEVMLCGWIEGIGLAAGARSADVRLVRSVHRGDGLSEYAMRWAR
jgi:hypothetical protein